MIDQTNEAKAKTAAVNKMRSSRIISFDIFDTLLGRTVASPMDVFRLMQSDIDEIVGYHVDNFVDLRRQSEKEALKRAQIEEDREDVTIADIYQVLGRLLSLDDDQIRLAMAVEMSWERRCLIPREAGKYLFSRAKSLHKDIILVSDMYLPKDFIEEILRENGYTGWVKFYLSADYGKSKRSGTLFHVVMSDFRCDPENIVHIGDNAKGDVSVPAAMGIKTVHLPRTTETMKRAFEFTSKAHRLLVQKGRTLSSSILFQTVADKLFDGVAKVPESAFERDPVKFGYSCLGPITAGFTRWLHSEARKKGITKLLFLSRDGQVLHRSYQNLLGQGAIPSAYVSSSRRVSHICKIRSEWDIRAIMAKPIYHQTFERFAQYRFGLKKEMMNRKVLRENGIEEPGQYIGTKTDREALLRIMLSHAEIIFSESQMQRLQYRAYLEEYVEKNDKIGLVDIGYAGTMQSEIMRILERDVDGFYLSCNEGTLNNGIHPDLVSGYIQDKTMDGLTKSGINDLRFLFETLICSAEDSFEGFEMRGSERIPTFASDEGATNRKGFVRMAHTGALRFSGDFIARWPGAFEDFWIGGKEAILLLEEFGRNPSKQDVDVLLDIEFEDKFATSHKRVLVASNELKTRTKVFEIWKQGVSAKGSKDDSSQKAPIRDHELRPQWSLRKVERMLIATFSTPAKLRKYERKRRQFFADSKYSIVRAYGAAAK